MVEGYSLWNIQTGFLHQVYKAEGECSTGSLRLWFSTKDCLLAFQSVLNCSCKPEGWYIQRKDEENTIY